MHEPASDFNPSILAEELSDLSTQTDELLAETDEDEARIKWMGIIKGVKAAAVNGKQLFVQGTALVTDLKKDVADANKFMTTLGKVTSALNNFAKSPDVKKAEAEGA